MIVRTPQASRVLLIRPGATDFDDQGRIKGILDMPMSERGRQQVSSLAEELSEIAVGTIYTAPCESARETAQQLAEGREVRIKVIDSQPELSAPTAHQCPCQQKIAGIAKM